jgi:ABC-2 type transport system ATP-binding protein
MATSTQPAAPPATATGSVSIIQIRGLTKRYRNLTAVNGIDLDVREGEIFGILGPNGAGKSTTLEMIEGLRKPDGGTITVDGMDAVRDSDRVRKIIGVQLQSTSLFPYLNARELVGLFGNFYELDDPEARVDELLGLVDLQEKANARVDELSGGQQQRLGIALALVNNPRVTFLDEPTTGLDPHARRNMWNTILGVRDAGTTVVLTTHYMEEAEVLCDRIAIMDGGNVIACDTPAGLIRSLGLEAVVSASIVSGQSPLTQERLAAIPGVRQATLADESGVARLSLHTNDAQATIVGLLALASETGTVLGELGSTRANLENVFLSLTGRSYEQQEDATGTGDEPQPGRKRRRRGGNAT